MSKIRSQCRGFTLVEIMVVIIVIAIVTAMVVPSLQGSFAGMRLDAAAGRVGELMDFCHQSAVDHQRVYGLIFDGDGMHYRVAMAKPAQPLAPPEDRSRGGEDNDEQMNGEPELRTITPPGENTNILPEGIRLVGSDFWRSDLTQAENDGVRILFFPDGSSEFAALKLANAHGDLRKVTLNGMSGKVEIKTPEPEENAT